MGLTIQEVFDQVEGYLQPRLVGMNVTIDVEQGMGTMYFRDKEGAPKIILMNYAVGWSCSFPRITSEQRKKVREENFRLTRDMGAYFWDIRGPGSITLEEVQRLEGRLLTLIKILFT